MSTDLAQVSGAQSVGAATGALRIGHDEFTANAGLNDAKIGTMRTYPNLTGFFLTNVFLRSALGSDFEFWQHRFEAGFPSYGHCLPGPESDGGAFRCRGAGQFDYSMELLRFFTAHPR